MKTIIIEHKLYRISNECYSILESKKELSEENQGLFDEKQAEIRQDYNKFIDYITVVYKAKLIVDAIVMFN